MMMATAHGGWCHASPFKVSDSLLYPVPMVRYQDSLHLHYFDHYLKGKKNEVEKWPLIYYYNLAEEKYKKSDVWPIENTTEEEFYLHAGGTLTSVKPQTADTFDTYKVDFGVYTSKKNRWTTQMAGPVINLNDRGEMDERMLCYTSSPMEYDVQITGTPIISLELSSTHDDGAVLVYLEDVDEKGKSTYITEGGLRLIHRKLIENPEDEMNLHSFNEEDAMPMIPGEKTNVMFKLWPTSVLIKKGHSIRVAIAGADKSVFDKFPKRGKPELTIYSGKEQTSFITLPIVKD